ncbi:MAG: YbdK family carboxylate-amine ligase [Actinomycetota bacterium]|nr:YbdK family carboxylate-amine ligase [Actinomycetota bacterium]
MNGAGGNPEWAEWKQVSAAPYSLGVEEELMLLDAEDFSLANRIEAVMPRLPETVLSLADSETHNSALELTTDVHENVSAAASQLQSLRQEMADAIAPLGLACAGAGTHPFAIWEEVVVTEGDRHEVVHGSMRELARREPTFALHVHVGLPDAETAIGVCDRMRVHLPVLLALSANSPFWQGRDTGLASARTPLFQAFPRVGIPRPFREYSRYVEAVDLLVRTGAIPDRSYLWWDIRPHPAIGTIEIRVMDAQSRTVDTAALIAFVQCLVKLEAEDPFASEKSVEAAEALDENRFLAARDGAAAELIDIDREERRPLTTILDSHLDRLMPHARELGCESELGHARQLAADPPADRQRQLAEEHPSLAQVLHRLTEELA